MSGAGAVLAWVAVTALCLAFRKPSAVGGYLDALAPRSARRPPLRLASVSELRQAGLDMTPDRFLILRVAAAAAGAVVVATVGIAIAIGPIPVLAAAYVGWVAPSLVVSARARARRREAERATIVLVERLCALIGAGRPAESALASLLHRGTGAGLLDSTLKDVNAAYLLGASLFRSLAHHARAAGLDTCAALAEDLERARDLGAGTAAIVRERRAALRQLERSRALEAASTVEGKLMLVLVLCYLPALMLLVVIPLFISLLDGLAL